MKSNISSRLLIIVLLFLLPSLLLSEKKNLEYEPKKNLPEVTLCTQNLWNYGTIRNVARRLRGFTEDDLIEKEQGLISRFLEAKCDVIAVQELLAASEQLGEKALQTLARPIKGENEQNISGYGRSFKR